MRRPLTPALGLSSPPPTRQPRVAVSFIIFQRYSTNNHRKYPYCLNIISQNRKNVCEVNSSKWDSWAYSFVIAELPSMSRASSSCEQTTCMETRRFSSTDLAERPAHLSLTAGSQDADLSRMPAQNGGAVPKRAAGASRGARSGREQRGCGERQPRGSYSSRQ